MSIVTSVSTVGSEKVPPCATLAPFRKASAMCASTFSTRLRVNERPDHRARLEPDGDLHRPGGLGEALRKCVIDAVLN